MGTMIWELVNSPFFVTTVATVVVFLLNKLYGSKPEWKKYEGSIIQAIRWAEKAIPDGTENKHMERFKHAFQYVLNVFAEVEKRQPSLEEERGLRDGIEIVCAELSAKEIV